MVKALLGVALALAAPAWAAPVDGLWLEAGIEPARVAVQTQANYTVRLYQGVAVRELAIDEPHAPLAEFRPIGEARVFEAVRDGRRYRVHERRYAVLPFASERLAIAGVQARVQVAGASGWRAVTVEAPPLFLDVLPVPADAAVAARSLRLEEDWSGTEGDGAVLRRRVRIHAEGVDAAQLPEIDFAVPGARVHAKPPRLESRFEDETLVALREQSFEVLADDGRALAVPELRLRWWNARSAAMEVAVLPARLLRGGAAPVADEAPAAQSASDAAQPALTEWPAFAAAGALVLAALLAWRRRARLRAAWWLARACRAGEPLALRDALLAWVAAARPAQAPLTLGALAASLDDAVARHAAEALDRALYGPASAAAVDAPASAIRRIKRGVLRP